MVLERDFVLRLGDHLHGLHLNTDVALACAATWAIACAAACSRIGRFSALMYALVVVRVFLVWFLCAKVVGEGFKGDLWKQLSSFDPAQLLDIQSWRLATEQSLYSVGCSRSFLRLAGWNRFFSDVRCVAPILAWTNFATTLMSTTMIFLLLFLMSERTDTELDAYFEPKEAPFVSVVQALLFLEPERSFSVLYFSLMFLTGICDLVIMQEVVMEVLVFDFPAFAERTVLAKAALCLFVYALSLPLCSGVGPYLVDLLDVHFKGTLYLLVNLAEVLVVTRVYGKRSRRHLLAGGCRILAMGMLKGTACGNVI
ncbi:sodium-dependent acetylcholine transporter-like [Rhipicephalus sanguineus]|uniref:sodium-dependent acetylcholine transporter-like n=1 Tax=Rhipicephalus sanguineus TaxID=34632 RepID=UPI0020C2FEF5|nr:sodium-dependent acetylcholine transporter-like [Rhipicephalus sanguineus]